MAILDETVGKARSPGSQGYATLGDRVVEAMAGQGITKAVLARKMEHTSWLQVHRICTGQRAHVTPETLRGLARALRCSSDYLLGLTDDPRVRV